MRARSFRFVLRFWPLAAALLLGCGAHVGETNEFAGMIKSATKVGTLDSADCEKLQGWGWDPQKPDEAAKIELYDGDKLLATVTADQFRKDLKAINLGDGKHGFVIDTPSSLRDGNPHAIHAKFAGSTTELNKSPQSLTCPQ